MKMWRIFHANYFYILKYNIVNPKTENGCTELQKLQQRQLLS